jgi:putative FmdB family regulatory protein
MPTYDYRCDHCGTVFAARRGLSEDASSVPCPDDGTAAVRLFSPPLDVLVYGKEYRTAPRTPPAPGPSAGGDHGHSHGPGGHSHGGHGHTHGQGGHTH